MRFIWVRWLRIQWHRFIGASCPCVVFCRLLLERRIIQVASLQTDRQQLAISRFPRISKFVILLWVVSMLPHVFGNVRARSRNHDIQLLSEWLRGEFGSLDPDSSLDDALEAAAALHPRDRDAFLETLLGDMGAVAVLSQYTIEQLLTRFEARREAACSLPVSTLPTVAQAESPLGTSQTRTQLAGSAVTGSATGIDIADVAGLIASEPIAQQRAAIDLSTGGPRGP